MPIISKWADIEERGGDAWLTDAEKHLIAACKAGGVCQLGDGKLPPENPPDPGREVRADLLRYLILGGCDECPVIGWGVRVYGAHVTGELDLSFARASAATGLFNCRFDQPVLALQSGLEALILTGSALPRLTAQGVMVTGDLFLRDITATATVAINGATIGGQLDCTGAKFEATEGRALNAQGVKVTESLFLDNITATATVDVAGATIGGQIDCTGARFKAAKGDALNAQGVKVTGNFFLTNMTATATVDVNSATIGGQLACDGASFEAAEGHALNAQGVKAEYLFWRNLPAPQAGVTFDSAHVGTLVDDPACWPARGKFDLDGLTYDRISGGPTDAATRIPWLERGSYYGGTFHPHPFTHLAKVLREMGHDRDARRILIHRETLTNRAERDRMRVVPDGDVSTGLLSVWYDLRRGWNWLWTGVFWAVAGYGYRPFNSVIVLIVLIAALYLPARWTDDEGSFAPNSGPILVSADWQTLAADPAIANPARAWAAQGAAGQDWESFSALAWSADIVIPIIDIGQTSAWAPSTERGPWGERLYWLRWIFTAAGWIAAALGAAAVTGIIRKD